MFDATEPAALARQLFGPTGHDYVSYRKRRRRSPQRFDLALRANARALWQLDDSGYRSAILLYAGSYHALECWSLAWDALEFDDEILVMHGIIALLGLTRLRKPGPDEISTLLRLIRAPGSETTRLLAIHILREMTFEPLEQLLVELSNDPDVSFRFEINLHRLHVGHDVSAPLFRDVDSVRYTWQSLQDLWFVRDKLELTSVQEERLWKTIKQLAAGTRRRCLTESRYPPGLRLASYLEHGLPMKKGDMERVAQAAFTPDDLYTRKTVIRALARFNNDESRGWLQRIADSDVPTSLRWLAKRELRKLEATPTRRG